MTLNIFLLLIIVLLPVMMLALYRGNKFSKSPIPYFLIIALALVLSYCTFTHYAKSHGGYYKNTEYHLIQQDGFKFSNGKLKLTSDEAPEKAILATDIGELELDSVGNLSSTDFKQPLYVEEATLPMHFKVVNINEGLSMEDGESLALRDMFDNDSTVALWIKYEEVREKKDISKYRFVFSIRNNENDTVEKTVFRQGYNLARLLQEGKRTSLTPQMRVLLENCFLVRGSYELDVVKPGKVSGKLYLFGADLLADRITVSKNGAPVGDISGNVKGLPMIGRQFFYGLGRTKSQVYKVTKDDNNVVVKYRLPMMYHFPEGLGVKAGETKMFLTTDKQEIIDRRGDFSYFYQFSDQFAYNSVYKAAAVLDFIIDSAGVGINPQYGDMNDYIVQSEATPITIGQPFEVRTLSCRMTDDPKTARVSYLFTIRDMRDNVVYQNTPKLYLVMLLMLLVIYMLLYYLNPQEKTRINKLYILETSVYLVLIAFLTVRLVLLWRLHTFPPIERVSYLEFGKLTNPQNFTWTFIAIVVVLALRMVILFLQTFFREKKRPFNFNEWLDNRLTKPIRFKKIHLEISRNWINWILAILLPILAYVICFLVGKIDELKVLANETMAPLLAFAINSLFYVYRVRIDQKDDKDEFRHRGWVCWFAMIWNTLVFMLFLLFIFKENGMLLPMAGVFGVWFFIIMLITPVAHKWFKWVMPVAVAIGLIIVFWHVPLAKTAPGKNFLSSMPDSFSRPKARLVATSMTPSEMVRDEKVEFKEKSMQDILNASSNKWFIENHLAQRYYLENTKHKKGFILDKNFTQKAVFYTTQTRDVLLARYLIYEHGRAVPKMLLSVLLMLAVNVFAVYKRKSRKHPLPFLQQLPLQSSIFLLMYSAYLFLVNINAVVFIGLDFPFLTLTSKVAPFGLMLPLLAMLLPANIKRQEESLVGDSEQNGGQPDWGKASVGVVTAVLMIGLIVLPAKRIENQIKENKGKSMASFSVSMQPLAEFINDYMNPLFKQYQADNAPIRKMKITDSALKNAVKTFVFGNNDGNTPLIDATLQDYVKKTKRKNDMPFIRSAFEKLFNTTLTETDNIIHVKKDSRGRFVFVPNKKYYDMNPIFDNDVLNKWNGDLLAAAGASRLTFTGENRKEAISLVKGFKEYGCADDVKNVDKLKDQFLGVNDKKMINFNIVQIPIEYCYEPEVGDHDVFILNPTDAAEGKSYVVYPLGDASNPIKEKNVALWVKPNDIVKVSDAKQSFSFKTESGQYFSKRIHYNGKHQVIYPLGKRYMFAYNFDQMLAESYHPVDSSTQPVRISLDYDLFNEVYDYCEKTMPVNKKSPYGEGITVTAIDGKGRIRLLADYNPSHPATMDPNQSKELRQIMDEIYLSGNRKEQRTLLQNRNVAYMAVGPGSTIKVPLYVAVASGTHLNWNNIKVSFHSKAATTQGDQAVVKNFGPYPTKGIHKGYDGWDEMSSEYSTGDMSPSRFIAKSNNFFFGSILALGTYGPTRLQTGLGGVLVPSQPNEVVFPKFCMGNNYYKFKDGFIREFEDSRVLENALKDNFHFYTLANRETGNQPFDIGTTDYLYIGDTTQTLSTRMRSMNSEYVYSERPKLLRGEFKNTQDDDVIKGILHLTSGGSQNLDVTPLDMAEMYLRIAQLNGAENILTYDDAIDSIPYKPFESINTDFATQMQQTTYLGMWNVLVDGTMANTTDKGLQTALSQKDQPIYLYGKTGTVGDKSVQKNDNRHYAIILSNKRLDQTTDRDGLKVFVVYFGFYDMSIGRGHAVTAPMRKAILEKIIESETFQNYWNE